MRTAFAVLFLLGCEHVSDMADSPRLVAPDAPEVETMRVISAERDPAPPKPAVAPFDPLARVHGATKQWFLALGKEQRHVVHQLCRALKKNPCLGIMPMRKGINSERDAAFDLTEQLATRDDFWKAEEFCRTQNRNSCNTPLVVAFDAQPIEFAQSAGEFAFAPGTPVASDWPTAETPWIAIDRDGDGAITSGAELFGDGNGDANGFVALAKLDGNQDGVIDQRDPAFARLLLWADTNNDRTSSPSELRPLSSVVVEIPLVHAIDARCVGRNCEGERGTLTYRAGDSTRTGAVVDVYLGSR